MRWLRSLRCWLGWCPFRPYSDAGGCGGQCVECGKTSGYVDRATLRRYADAEWARYLAEKKRDA